MELKYNGSVTALLIVFITRFRNLIDEDIIGKAVKDYGIKVLAKKDDTLGILLNSLYDHLIKKFNVFQKMEDAFEKNIDMLKREDLGDIDMAFSWVDNKCSANWTLIQINGDICSKMTYEASGLAGCTYEESVKFILDDWSDMFEMMEDSKTTLFLKQLLPKTIQEKLAVAKVTKWLHSFVEEANYISTLIKIIKKDEIHKGSNLKMR